MFRILARDVLVGQVNQHEVVVRAAGNQVVPGIHQELGQHGGIGDHALLVAFESGAQGFTKGHCLGRDNMHERTALNAGENLAVQGFAHVFGRKNHAATGAAQGFVRGCGGDVGVRKRALVQAGGHKTGDMGHVHHQLGANFVGDFAEAGKVDGAGVGAGTGNDGGGLVLAGEGGHFVIVDAASFALHTVRNNVEQAAREVHRAAVGKMPAVRKIHAQNGVAGLHEGKVGGHVGLRTRVRLHVGVFAVKQLLGAVLSQGFGYVHIFATAVIALAGVAFCILVGKHAALSFTHCAGNKVFRSDELKLAHLAVGFKGDGSRQFRVLQQDFVHDVASF